NALQEQDEDLVQIIRELQEAKGRGERFDPRRLSEKVEVIGPPIDLSSLKSNIFAEILDKIGVSWDEWYGRLILYKEREGHCSVPKQYKTPDGDRLGQWVSVQRSLKDRMSDERRARLDALGFDWTPHDTDWETGFGYLKRYYQREGHYTVGQ